MVPLQRHVSDRNERALTPMFSRYTLSASGYIILALSGVTLITWPWQGFVVFMHAQRVPYTFLAVVMGLLVAQTYLHLRLGRGEIGIRSYFTRETMHQEYLPTEVMTPFLRYGFPRACLHIAATLLPALPVLLVATVVSGFSTPTLLKALSVVFLAALVCRLWGFWVYELWGNSSILGYFVARLFLAGAIYLSGFLAAPVSPLRVLYRLEGGPRLWPGLPLSPYPFYLLTALGWLALLVGLCEWRGRHHRRKRLAEVPRNE